MVEESNKKQLKKALVRIIVAVILFGTAGLLVALRKTEAPQYTMQVIPPTCTDSGYTLYTNQTTGSTDIREVVEATGHTYRQWQLTAESTDIEPEIMERVCDTCADVEAKAEYPDIGLARLTLRGDFTGIGKKTEVKLTAEFSSPETSFSTYATAKYQGHSTLVYEKKNYTVKFYEDSEYSKKQKMVFSHWNPENKYILKANFQDTSQSKNLLSADIWADMVKSRITVPEELATLSNYGAVDGFPVALYTNDNFQGLYTMNLHKDDDLFGMKDGESHAIMIINHDDGEEAFFRAEAQFGDDTPWEVEFCGTEDSAWAKDRLNSLIQFVQTADDESFRKEIGNYLDIDSAIDYLIAMYALGLEEHCAKDLVLVTYGQDEPWFCSMYDMEEAFDTDGVLPIYRNGRWDSGTGSLLWDRLLNLYYSEICNRYASLRQSVLRSDVLCEELTDYIAQIPQQLYYADAQINKTPLFDQEAAQEMMMNISSLIERTDEVFAQKGA